MKSNIQIKFLSKKEFEHMRDDDFRYEHVDGDNLGFSDKAKNRVFVRSGLDADLTKYLINHEIDHLYELEGTHEDEHGIRHKKGNFWANLFDPGGVFHEGNALGIGHNEGKAGLGEVIKPFAGDIGAGIGTLFGGPAGGAAGGAIGNGLGAFMPQGKVKDASFQGPSFGSMFSPVSQTSQGSFGQGFGQQGSFAPSSQGYSGGSQNGLFQPGLGQAGISMGAGAQNNQDQSGYYRPTFKF